MSGGVTDPTQRFLCPNRPTLDSEPSPAPSLARPTVRHPPPPPPPASYDCPRARSSRSRALSLSSPGSSPGLNPAQSDAAPSRRASTLMSITASGRPSCSVSGLLEFLSSVRGFGEPCATERWSARSAHRDKWKLTPTNSATRPGAGRGQETTQWQTMTAQRKSDQQDI